MKMNTIKVINYKKGERKWKIKYIQKFIYGYL